MSFAPALIWVLIFALRALSAKSTGAGPGRRPSMDSMTVMEVLAQTIVVCMLLATLGFGWLQLLFSVWLVAAVPRWAVWRICQPRRWRRAGLVLLSFIAGGPDTRAGRRRVYEWSLGVRGDAPPDDLPATLRQKRIAESPLIPVDGWTACAAALRAEAAGDAAHADRLVRGLCDLPSQPRLPGTAARAGVELLALAALHRDDMAKVLQRASLGRGRGCRFLRLLSRAHLFGDVPPAWLWTAWALAPHRRRTHALVRAALARTVSPPRTWETPARSPWGLHVRMLERAARGERIERARVLRLARLWDGPLGAEGQARLRARALELDVIDPDTAGSAVQTRVLAEIEALAAVAVGSWPDTVTDDGLPGLVRARAENRLFADLEPWVKPYRDDEAANIRYPLEEWERWLTFRSAFDRLEEALGEEAVASSWYGGVRLAGWNWPCRLLDVHQERAAWLCHVMFEWTAATAERIGDEEAASVNRENAAVAARMLPRR